MKKQANSSKMYNIAPGVSVTVYEDGSGSLYIEGQETVGLTIEQVEKIMKNNKDVKDEDTKTKDFYDKTGKIISRLKKNN